MTANLRIVPLNHWDAATLSTSAALATGYPITNTQNSIRESVARTTSNAAQDWKATWGAAPVRTATFIGIFAHTAGGPASTGTFRLQLFSDAAWSSSVYDSGALSANNITPAEVYDFGISTNDPFAGQWPFWIRFTEKTFRSATISWGGTPLQNSFQASRVFIGKHKEVAVNPDYGMTLGYLDNTKKNRSLGGSSRRNVGALWRVMNLDLNRINENERATWLYLYRLLGTGRDFVIDGFPADGTTLERDHLFNGTLSALNPIGRQVSWLTTKLQVEEV